jgi:hypothetical protein
LAQALDVAQPALSRQVRLLEVELRQNLLIRNGRGALPTEAGKLLLEHGLGILHQVERAREELGRVRDGLVNGVVLGLQRASARAEHLASYERYGGGADRFPSGEYLALVAATQLAERGGQQRGIPRLGELSSGAGGGGGGGGMLPAPKSQHWDQPSDSTARKQHGSKARAFGGAG